jgi:hypothetical protein
MGSHKHGVSGHARNNPVDLREVARELNRDADTQAALRDQRRHEGMADSVREALSGEPQPAQGKEKRAKKQSRRRR